MGTRQYHRGELVYRAGEPGNEIYQVIEGTTRIYTLTTDGRELLYELMPPGACFGESSLIDAQPRPHMAQAVTDVKLRVLELADFQALWRESPELSHAVALVLCRRTRRLYEIYEGVSLAALSRRMARRLCVLADSIGEDRDDGVHFQIRLTQEDIGSLVAGSRQSVNKILKQWQCDGLINLAYGSLVIRQLATLEQLANTGE
nr:Crp/Fnr family transcriptional regulator [Parahaliea mediterranea]